MEKRPSYHKSIGDKNVLFQYSKLFLQILDKKVKKNPKYENVKSMINTGKTMKNVEIISKNTYLNY